MDWTAILFVVAGAGLLGGTLGLGLWFARRQLRPVVAAPVALPAEYAQANAGVLLTRGSRIEFVNERAKEFFDLNGQLPRLERLRQKVQPAEEFMALFGAEGHADLSIGDHRVEAFSLRLKPEPDGISPMVVMFRETELRPELSGADERTVQTINLIADINRDITSSLELNDALNAILGNLGRAFQYDFAEITLWDEVTQSLKSAGTLGDHDFEEGQFRVRDDFAAWIATQRQPLLVSDVATFTQIRTLAESADFPFRSYMGVPLLIGTRFLGALELATYQAGIYRADDLFFLNAIAGQAATAIHNAQLFAEQQRRVAELTGLAEITRALESTSDPRELYGRLTADIARFMGVQMVGFLLPDAQEDFLIGQAPFHGVPDIVVELYRIPLTPGSLAAKMWGGGDYWLSNNIPMDPLVDEAGLRQLAEAAGVKTTLMTPIAVGGRRLGAVQVSNKANGAPFTDMDVRLLLIFAGQAAAILDNARLVRETQARAEQADGLRQIAVTIASRSDLNTIMSDTVREAAQLLRFDFAMIALLDEARGELVPHPASVYGGPAEEAEAVRLRMDDPQFALSVTRLRRPFRSGRALTDKRITGFYRPLIERFQVNSVMALPLVVGDRSLGELVVGAKRERAFTRADQQLLSTIAAQLASAIERARLAEATDQNLQRRVDQLTALTRVGRELNQTMQLERILRLVYDEAVHATQADAGTIVLLDLMSGEQRVALRIGDSDPDLGQALTALEQEAVTTERPRQITFPTADPVTASRVELVIPILAEGLVVGLFHLRRREAVPFDETAIETAAALAAQTAIAVGNAQRYEEQLKRGELLRRRADQLTQLFEISQAVRSDRSLVSNLEAIAFGLQEAVGFNVVMISVLDQNTRRLRRTAAAGVPLQVFEQARRVEPLWEKLANVLRDEFRISQSYFLPHEQAAELTESLQTISVTKTVPANADSTTWHPDDMLVVPLRSPQGGKEPIGVLTLDDPRSGLRPDRNTVEVIEIFANQAALAIENTQLFQAAERRAARLLALHRVVERVSLEADPAQLWQTAAEGIWSEMGRDVCLIALKEQERLIVRGKAGRIRTEIDFGPLLTSASPNPLTQAISERAPLLVLNIRDSDWAINPTVLALGVKSFISVPLMSYDQAIGAVFVGSNFLPTPFVREDQDLFLILASQLGALAARAELEGDVRQRANQLGALAVVSRTITAALRTEDVIRAVLDNLHNVIAYDSVTLWLREGEQLRIAAAQGFNVGSDTERLGLRVDIVDSALFAEMARTRSAILVPDVRADERFPAGELQPTRTWLAAPLVSQDRIIGALALDKTEVNAYSQAATQVLLAFANQAAVALENARLFEDSAQRSREVDERSQRLALLNRFSAELSGTLNLDRIFDITLEEMKRAFEIDSAAMIQFGEAGQATLVRQSPVTETPPDPYNPALQRVRETLAPLAIEDVQQDTMLAEARTGFLRRQVKSLLVLPLVVAGQPVAALQLESTTQRRFTPEEIELAQTLAYQSAVTVQNARLYAETQARLVELATFNQISRAITSTISLTDIYQTVAEQVSAVMGADNIYLALYDENRQLLTFPIFVERGQLILAEPREPSGLSAHVIRNRQPMLLRGDDISAQLAELGAGQIGPNSAKSFLAVPLITSDRVIGVIGVQDLDRANAFDEAHERLLTTIAAQVAVAIENARLYTEVQSRAIELSQRNERLAALNRISAILSAASLNLDTILRQAAEQATQLFRVDHSSVVLFDDTGALVEAEYPEIGLVGSHLTLADNPLQAELLTTRLPVAVPEVATDPRLVGTARDNLTALGVRSLLVVPFVSQGEAIGSFSLDAIRAPRRFTDDEIELCQIIAAQIAVAVENARFTQELESRVTARTREVERERERVETLLQITTELASNLELDRVLQRALQLVTEAVNAPRGSVFLQDFSSDQLVYRAALGRPKPLPPGGEPAPFKWNEGLVGWVMKNRQAVVLGDLEHDPRWKHLPDHPTAHKSALAVPLMSNGDALGAMVLLSPDYNAFDEDQLRLVSAAADRVGDAINNAELYRLIREQAEKLGSLLRGQQVEATKNRAILEGIADGVLVTDTGGRIILLNAACQQLLGLKADEVLSRPMADYVGVYGAAGKTWMEASTRWSDNPASYQLGEFLEERIELEDQRVLSIHLSPVTANEEYLGAVSLIRDITRDVEVDRLKSEFVTNVSHELRTPMTSIKGYADILLMGAAGSLNENQSRFIEVIKNNADRLSILVNDLLDISRIESGRVQLELRALSMREILQAVADNLRGRIDEEHKPMQVVIDLPPDLPPVWADRERVTQIITNLADNAFNYSHAESVITLKAGVAPERAEVVLEVTDTGLGIPPDDQTRLFDRFYRGEDALVLATPGTGLGLPIARQLAEMHGGRLWLMHSETGKGSTFALALPIAKE